MNLLTDLDALLITDPYNIRYLTGFNGLSPEEREGYVLITKEKIYLFTHALYLEQTEQLSINNSQLTIIEVSREQPLPKHLAELVKKHRISRLGFEEVNLTFAEHQLLTRELKEVQLIPTRNRVEELRQIKHPDEIESIRRAATLTDKCFEMILKKIKPGVTEAKLAWEIESFFRKNGAGIAFSPIVAFNDNSSQPHHQSNNQQLTINNLILFDFGARVNGYCADMTRVVFLGKPTDEQRKVYETVLNAQSAALDLLSERSRRQTIKSIPSTSSGNTVSISGAELDHTARNIIEKADLPPYPHSLGHNVGLAIHEGPRLSVKKDEALLPGMVFSIEPAVYLPGKFGIRIEDLIVLHKEDPEILSKSPKHLIIL